MKRWKVITSWLLIVLYTMVLVHNALPHDHQRSNDMAEMFGAFSSHSYPHSHSAHSHHHSSWGVFDFLASLFNGFDHSDLGPGHFDNFVKVCDSVQLPEPFAQALVFLIPDLLSAQLAISNEVPAFQDTYRFTIHDSPSHSPDCVRGPPSHS